VIKSKGLEEIGGTSVRSEAIATSPSFQRDSATGAPARVFRLAGLGVGRHDQALGAAPSFFLDLLSDREVLAAMTFKIGVISDSFRQPVREGLRLARQVGADGVQIYAVAGEMAPENLNASARADLRALCADLGLEIAALCGDLGGHGFQLADENPAKIARSKAIVDLAADLGAAVVTTHIGVVPEDPSSATYRTMLEACRTLGDYGESRGVAFAIETGPETAARLRGFLDEVASRGIGANLDPANLVMVMGDDPVQAVYSLRDHIVHTHAKDGVQLRPCDPVEVYGAFATGGFAALEEKMGRLFEELPLGRGAVDWDAYLAALGEIGYGGYLTIEREVGADPAADIAHAVRFLRAKIG
jgi:sugar phosphate isomerase/epimerase